MSEAAHSTLNLLLRWQAPPLGGAEGPGVSDDLEAIWRGVGFDLLGRHLVAPFGQVAEVIPCGPVAQWPRTRPWIRGLVSVRGQGLAVIDLSVLAGRQRVARVEGARLLVIRSGGIHAALLADRVHGLLRFPLSARQSAGGDVDRELKPYVKEAFVRGGENWGIFDFALLMAEARFQHASEALPESAPRPGSGA